MDPPAPNEYTYTYGFGDEPIPGYVVQHGVGRGGFGEVYRVHNAARKAFAIKLVLHGEVRELRAANSVLGISSPYVVQLLDIRRSEKGRLLLLMDFVSGPTLRDHLDSREEPVPLGEAVGILASALKGLATLHENDLMHRDLKPQNLFHQDGLVKIGDHGLVRVLTESDTHQMSGRVGTLAYMAPEMLEGRFGPESDLWALGVTFYEMLTGVLPFKATTEAALLVSIREQEPDLSVVPRKARGFLEKALAKDPERRFRSAEEMAAGLEEVTRPAA